MSRSYSIKIPVEIIIPRNEQLKSAGFNLVFTMLEVLSPERMKELLREQLLEKGFIETEKGLEMPVTKNRSAVFDLETLSMKLEVPLPETCSVLVAEEFAGKFKEMMQRAIEANTLLDDQFVGDQIEILKARAINELKDMAVSARKEVNAALKEVYRQAIKEKAATLGNVENVSESKEGNTYRIRIEVSV